MIRVLIAAVLAASCADAVWAQPAPPVRSEVAIREVVLSDGARRYTVPVKVGSTTLEAGLDTGSSGLRVLAGVLGPDDARAGGRGDTYAYGSGAKLDGVVGDAEVAIGALSAPIGLQLIRKVGCTSDKPDCPVSKLAPAQYGVQGDGLPGEGFKAIIGVNMAEAEVPTPLHAIGARRWIVELPRPGEADPGRLILNPSEEDTQGFVMLPVISKFDGQQGGLHDALAGCLVNASTHQKACGAVLLDCGAPGITVVNGGLGAKPWPDQTPVLLVFYDSGGKARAAESLVTGLRAHASRLSFRSGGEEGSIIYSGLSAYFAFSVLYDPQRGMVGLKPRPQAQGGPKGELIAAQP